MCTATRSSLKIVVHSEIVSELRSKEYNLLFHGLPSESPEETPEQSEHVIRGAARIFLRGEGAEIMEAKAIKRKNCL